MGALFFLIWRDNYVRQFHRHFSRAFGCGEEQAIAAAVAEAIVKHSDDRHPTGEDMVRMEANLQKLLTWRQKFRRRKRTTGLME